MTEEIFPHPRIFKELHDLVREEFPKNRLLGYSETLQAIGTGLEQEVVKVLENYANKYSY